jgi:NitT/TauT family transport system permease protein
MTSALPRAVATIGLVIVVVGFVWHLLVLGLRIPPYLVPEPLAVLRAVGKDWKVLSGQTTFTVTAAGLGLLVSTTFATLIAVAFSMSPRLSQASLPVVVAFRSAPVAAVAPIIMLFLGRGVGTSIAVVTIVSFFPLLVNLSRGLTAADGNATELLHVYGASRWQQLRFVRVPYALPYLFTGLRIAGASAILGAMLSEWITGSRGLGNLILDAGEMRETELLWAAVLTSVAIALSVFWVTSAGERRVLHWRRT